MKKIAILFLLVALVWFWMYQTTHRTLLITGCARSGTKFIAESLRAQGLRIGHERMGGHGVSGWDLAAGLDVGRWKVRRSKYKFDHVFHQTRHPLSVISSVYVTEDAASWSYIMAHTPEIHEADSHLTKCAKYWYYWNLKAEAIAEWRYRVEDIDHLWGEFGARLGKQFDRAIIEQVPKNIHTKGIQRHEFSWEDLERELDPQVFALVTSLAKKYDYY